jgi:hypothetical protein
MQENSKLLRIKKSSVMRFATGSRSPMQKKDRHPFRISRFLHPQELIVPYKRICSIWLYMFEE